MMIEQFEEIVEELERFAIRYNWVLERKVKMYNEYGEYMGFKMIFHRKETFYDKNERELIVIFDENNELCYVEYTYFLEKDIYVKIDFLLIHKEIQIYLANLKRDKFHCIMSISLKKELDMLGWLKWIFALIDCEFWINAIDNKLVIL